MRKSSKLQIVILIILSFILIIANLNKSKTNSSVSTEKKQEINKEVDQNKFEVISQYQAVGYVRPWRAFAVYTNSKDKNEMIKFARTLSYTEGGQTFVHFFNDKENTPYIGQASNEKIGLYLEGATEYYQYMLGTYHKYPNKKEEWYNKDDISKDEANVEEIK